jgi:hypothetical protein
MGVYYAVDGNDARRTRPGTFLDVSIASSIWSISASTRSSRYR